jgi:hypothetical protein
MEMMQCMLVTCLSAPMMELVHGQQDREGMLGWSSLLNFLIQAKRLQSLVEVNLAFLGP